MNSHKIEYHGKTYKSKTELLREKGLDSISIQRFYQRLKHNWSLECALTVAPSYSGNIRAKDHLGNEYESLASMAAAYGIAPSTLFKRLEHVDIKTALTTPLISRGDRAKGFFRNWGKKK